MRRITAVLGAAALLTASLAGCTVIPGGGCEPAYDNGAASSLVTATGTVGSAPTVDFPTPLVATDPQATVLETGDGDQIEPGQQVDYDFTLLDGTTGATIGKSGYTAGQFARIFVNKTISVGAGLECATVGSRVAVVSTWKDAKDAFTADVAGAPDDTATVVVVVDVLASYLGKADGRNLLPKDGQPTVATEVNGTPGIAVPAQDPPQATQNSVIKGGDGAVLAEGDQAVVHYTLWTWPTTTGDPATFVGSSWDGTYAAVTLGLKSLADGGGVPKGLLDALVGQRVGSQVLSVIPPGDDNFPADSTPVSADSTYIFVVDILGIQK